LDAIWDLTAFRYSDFGRFLVCNSPPETVPETVKKTSASNFFGVRPYFVVYLPDYTGQSQRTLGILSTPCPEKKEPMVFEA